MFCQWSELSLLHNLIVILTVSPNLLPSTPAPAAGSKALQALKCASMTQKSAWIPHRMVCDNNATADMKYENEKKHGALK